jgi:hypothetical protein
MINCCCQCSLPPNLSVAGQLTSEHPPPANGLNASVAGTVRRSL